MTPEQQSAWDTVYTASLCAPGSGMELTREDALVLIDMMAQPFMPPEPTPEALRAMYKGYLDGLDCPSTVRLDATSYAREYRALHAHLCRPKTRTEWWVTGHAANGAALYSETARTEAARDSFYRSALGTAGVERVTIDVREVQA